MPHISSMIPSKFITKSDLEKPILLTIKRIYESNFNDGSTKWTLDFVEFSKPFALNKTNLRLLPEICGSENSEDWVGKQIVIYFDKTIMYKGKLEGGVRIRARNNPATGYEKINIDDIPNHVQKKQEQYQDGATFSDKDNEDVPF